MNLYKEQSGMRTQTTQTTPEYKFIKAVIKYLLSAKIMRSCFLEDF